MIAPLVLTLALNGVAVDNPLVWLKADKCKADSQWGAVLPEDNLWAQLLETYPLKVEAAAFDPAGPRQSLAAGIVRAGRECAVNCKGNTAAMSNLYAAARDILHSSGFGAFTVRWTGPGEGPARGADDVMVDDAKVRAFYTPGGGYVVTCREPGSKPPIQADAGKDRKTLLERISIAATVGDFDKDAVSKRDAAKVSYKVDDVADTAVATTKIAVLLPAFIEWPGVADTPSHSAGSLRLFGAYDRQTAPTRDKETNNLDLGVSGLLTFDPGPGGERFVSSMQVNLSWQTDDRFKSSVTRLEALWRPPGFIDAVPALATYHAFGDPMDNGYRWTWLWDLKAVADYGDIGDPGDKVKLAALPNYRRLGYDAQAQLRWGRRAGDPSMVASFDYQLRDDQRRSGADAQLLKAKLVLQPVDAGGWSVGLEYSRGENLSSLERIDSTLLSLGYKR